MKVDAFTGGISAQLDATKTGPAQYRVAINTRVRKNTVEPAFQHVKMDSPAGVKQAVFALDNKLILVTAGTAYWLNGATFVPCGNTQLSATADVIYHANVPKPSNYFVGPNKTYASIVSTTPLVAVLQDGINQAALLSSDLAMRRAKTYTEWSYSNPEYVPVGKLMTFSGSVLYVVSSDGTSIARSVSGRPLDFVLSFNSGTGVQMGDAWTTATSVSTAPLTFIAAAQDGGFLAATRYMLHGVTPITDLLIFGEPYLQPKELFPVGIVGKQAMTLVKGETAYVSPAGIQLFNQTAQQFRESNAHPLGAPITSLLVKPLADACACTADDYTFFAVETMFGNGIVVYDTILEQFVSIDLTAGRVKEFAVYQDSGVTRLFYITDGDELYEIPLYSGQRACAAIYFGEWLALDKEGKQDPVRRHRISNVHLGLTNVKEAGYVSIRSYMDREEQEPQVIPIDAEGEVQLDSKNFPFIGESPSAVYPVAYSSTKRGMALGLRLDIACDCRLAALSVETDVFNVDSPRSIVPAKAETYKVIGNERADSIITSDDVAESGQDYYAEARSSSGAYIINAESRVVLPAGGHVARNFTAYADRLTISGSCAVYHFQTLQDRLGSPDRLTGVFLLGSLDATDTYTALARFFRTRGYTVHATANDLTQSDTTRAKDFFGCFGKPRYYLMAGRDIDFYCLSFPLTSGSPPELLYNGEYATWVKLMISQRSTLSPRRINVIMTPISPYLNATFGAWPFARMGVHAIIAAGSELSYKKETRDGVLWTDVGQVQTSMSIESMPRNADLVYTNAIGYVDRSSLIS